MNKNNCPFLVVQGRTLVQKGDSIQYFPFNWKEEFPLIQQLGFDGIEWIYDTPSENTNPIMSSKGRKEIQNLSQYYDVSLENIVLDWFLTNPLTLDSNANFLMLQKLISHSYDIGFKNIILPLLEHNQINTSLLFDKFIINFSNMIIPLLDSMDIQLHFETSLPPNNEVTLLQKLSHKKLNICFDMGNSASFGFKPQTTLNSISDFLGSVHIKDRILHGSSVPLGTGDVNFLSVFEILEKLDFTGPISFQLYRNKELNNIQILKNAKKYVEQFFT